MPGTANDLHGVLDGYSKFLREKALAPAAHQPHPSTSLKLVPFVAHTSARQRALAEGSDQAGAKSRRPSEVSTNAIVHCPAARFPSLCPYRRLSLQRK